MICHTKLRYYDERPKILISHSQIIVFRLLVLGTSIAFLKVEFNFVKNTRKTQKDQPTRVGEHRGERRLASSPENRG